MHIKREYVPYVLSYFYTSNIMTNNGVYDFFNCLIVRCLG